MKEEKKKKRNPPAEMMLEIERNEWRKRDEGNASVDRAKNGSSRGLVISTLRFRSDYTCMNLAE